MAGCGTEGKGTFCPRTVLIGEMMLIQNNNGCPLDLAALADLRCSIILTVPYKHDNAFLRESEHSINWEYGMNALPVLLSVLKWVCKNCHCWLPCSKARLINGPGISLGGFCGGRCHCDGEQLR